MYGLLRQDSGALLAEIARQSSYGSHDEEEKDEESDQSRVTIEET